MAELEQLHRALINADAAGDTQAATALAAEIRKTQTAPANPMDQIGADLQRMKDYSPRDTIGGLVRGAGSIGATLLRPFESKPENDQRRTAMDQGLTTAIGSNPESMQYKSNKLIAELAGTAGTGGAVANVVGRIPGAAAALPTLLPAIQSGGMTANGAKGLYGLANRVAGGAVTGAASAGLVNPEDAKGGALIGGAAPAVVQTLGSAGQLAGRALGSGKPINPVIGQTARESVDAGYVIPPNLVQPNFKNQVIESFSGKQATQQIASTKNTQNTERLIRADLGIPNDVMLSKSTLENLRKTAGKAYADVSALSPEAAADLEALKLARNEAQGWFNAYNRSASPTDLAKAKDYRTQASDLEGWLEWHAASAGKSDLIPKLREARTEIAKTYTVERALNDASGSVDARVLGRMYEKGAPLTDGMLTAGKFASAFPSVAKSPQQVGSPASHNLKSVASMLAGGGGYAALGPLGIAASAVPFVVPPVARSMMFSKGAQQRLGSGLLQADPQIGGLLTQEAYRAAPLLLSQ